jgi:hypothetical protein
MFACNVYHLLFESGGRLPLSAFESEYLRMFGTPCQPAQFGQFSIISLLQSIPGTVLLRGRTNKKRLVLNKDLACEYFCTCSQWYDLACECIFVLVVSGMIWHVSIYIRGGIQNIPDWCHHLYSCHSANHQTVNSGIYCVVLWWLYENVRRHHTELWREQTWLLHHDNALSHTSILTHHFLAKQEWLSSPTHCSTLIWNPVTSSCFQKIKLKMKGRRFDTIGEIQAESQRVLDTDRKGFQEAFQKWRRQWDRCLHVGGSYFEGDGGR